MSCIVLCSSPQGVRTWVSWDQFSWTCLFRFAVEWGRLQLSSSALVGCWGSAPRPPPRLLLPHRFFVVGPVVPSWVEGWSAEALLKRLSRSLPSDRGFVL